MVKVMEGRGREVTFGERKSSVPVGPGGGELVDAGAPEPERGEEREGRV